MYIRYIYIYIYIYIADPRIYVWVMMKYRSERIDQNYLLNKYVLEKEEEQDII